MVEGSGLTGGQLVRSATRTQVNRVGNMLLYQHAVVAPGVISQLTCIGLIHQSFKLIYKCVDQALRSSTLAP